MPTSSSGWTAPEALNRSWPKTEKGNKPMAVVSSHKDDQALTLTFVAEFDASVERVWQVWQDPRQLERWWGPPTWPATFEQHDFVVGGRSRRRPPPPLQLAWILPYLPHALDAGIELGDKRERQRLVVLVRADHGHG